MAALFSVFLIGWAVGGILFGILADRYGRTKTLIATILLYATFTGMAALSLEWWHLAIYRFLTALGIGGEWAAGAAVRRRNLAGRETREGRRNPTVRVGCRILFGCCAEVVPDASMRNRFRLLL